ncbi:DNA-binding transcriptional LysR family regulator [Tibeticola sediminis]|uniref:DNA-binding transcriptional LysR family regulator n=1 Tax=Tibeticola sediminis TaxID=1917811 RepID=A0A3N4UP18_9BURK|nr:LysR family transcriptional regulator [Tibeticola sediminis]RPE72396.1 DNA-binding transcriptional LysR family regulator [Tibeticola sediminis]
MDSLDLLRTFREVARRGSFAGAARTLDLSKANVSKYIAALEAQLGVRLFNRSTRSVSLTDAGELLLERSEPLLEMVEATRAELQERARAPSGRLRVAAPHGLARTLLPPLLAEFLPRYPKVHLSLVLSNTPADLIAEGIDVALRVGRIGDDNLIVRRLQRVPFVVAATPGFWKQHGYPTHPDQLGTLDALTLTPLQGAAQWRFEVEGEPVSVPVHSRMDASDTAPLIAMATAGLGMVWLPQVLVQEQIESGTLQAALSDYSPRDIWLYAAYTQRRHNSAALKAFLQVIEARWREPDAP